MSRKKVKTEETKPTPEQAKAIFQKARQKDAEDCIGIINKALKDYRCAMFGKIRSVQAGVVQEITASGQAFDFGVIALKE